MKAEEFKTPLLQSLASLCPTQAPVNYQDVFDLMLKNMGIEKKTLGMHNKKTPRTLFLARKAFQRLKKEGLSVSGPRRGTWSITEAGLERVRQERASPSSDDTVVKTWQLEQLASQTACLGHFEFEHPECSKCCVASFCRLEKLKLLTKFEDQLLEEEKLKREKALRDAIAKEQEADSLLEAEQAAQIAHQLRSMPNIVQAEIMVTDLNNVCAICYAEIKPETTYINTHDPKGGVYAYHVGCAQHLLKGGDDT